MANKVFRQAFSTGVALAGAGAIALSPVTITPDIHAVVDTPRVVTMDVAPAGLFHDLRSIADGARAAVGQSVDAVTRKAPDLWWTVHEHWPDPELTHWNYALVSDILLAPITPLVIGPLNDAVAEAVARNFPVLGDQIRQVPKFLEYAFVRLVGPLLSAIGAAGYAHTEIYYSTTTYRIEPFIKAIVRAPFHVIDGLLFGGYGDLGPILPGREGAYLPAPGLLTPWGQQPRVRNIKTPNDIVTAIPDVRASVHTLSVDVGESASTKDSAAETGAAADAPETSPKVPAAEPLGNEADSEASTPSGGTDAVPDEPAATESVDTDETTPSAPAVRKDPGARVRQHIKDFRTNVRNTVKKLTGGTKAARDDAPSARDAKSDAQPSGGSDPA
ncbi:hypothetical protein V4U86_25495 [Mycobacterium sp. AMU20-3851]|uniref:hypothetical protein n=1 Tax=Mycobacterium sp. AMU20-3851 TaxID=3122055 RepID=UPI0037553CF0